MCGRFVVTKATSSLLPDLIEPDWELPDDFNVAPTVAVPSVRNFRGERQLEQVRWGFIPAWYKDAKRRPQPINARMETVATSGMFARQFARARCIVPALGYYEWTVLPDGSKQPHFIYEPDSGLAMAGVLSAWPDPSKEEDDPDKWLVSMAVITRDAHVAPGEVHDRMPACLVPGAYDTWLDPAARTDDLLAVLDASSYEVAHALHYYPVSKDANSVRNNSPALIEPLPA